MSYDRRWMWVPFFVIGAAIIPNAIMMSNAKRLRPTAVEPQAWDRSRDFDLEREERRAFQTSGFSLHLESAANGDAKLRLQGPGDEVSALKVFAYWAAHNSGDVELEWRNPGQPLVLAGLDHGNWTFTVVGSHRGRKIRGVIQTNPQQPDL